MLLIVIAIILGCMVGFGRSKFNKLAIDEKTNSVYCKTSIIDIVVLVILIFIKFAAETFLSKIIHGNTLLMCTNYLLLFSISAIISKRIIILFKYLKIVSSFNAL